MKLHTKLKCAYFVFCRLKKTNNEVTEPLFMQRTNPTEPANYLGSYTAEYRVITAGILKKGAIKRWQ
jgi:hypothetical protein